MANNYLQFAFSVPLNSLSPAVAQHVESAFALLMDPDVEVAWPSPEKLRAACESEGESDLGFETKDAMLPKGLPVGSRYSAGDVELANRLVNRLLRSDYGREALLENVDEGEWLRTFEVEHETSPDRRSRLFLYAEEFGSVAGAGAFVSALCQEFSLPPVPWQWSAYCSTTREGEFVGGAVVSSAQGTEHLNVHGWLQSKVRDLSPKAASASPSA